MRCIVRWQVTHLVVKVDSLNRRVSKSSLLSGTDVSKVVVAHDVAAMNPAVPGVERSSVS